MILESRNIYSLATKATNVVTKTIARITHLVGVIGCSLIPKKSKANTSASKE